MVIERPPDWMPDFSYATARAPHPSTSAPGLRSYSNPPQSPQSSNDDDSSSSSITNRCSPKVVHAMVSKLSEFKKQLVRDIGFGGILDIPCINKVNLRLSAWLLTKLDTEDSELVFSESRRIYIHEKDVGIVFGVPCGEIDVASREITAEQIESIKVACGISSKESRIFKGLEHILEKHLDDRSSRTERDSFKIAFVIFVMGHLLDFWGALKDAELLERMNWCRYVYSHVLDAAQKARDEIIRKNRVTNLSGCHLFLQVLFLDNVDIRGLNKNHSAIPRIKVFDAESLKRMTTMCESRGGYDFDSFIGNKLYAIDYIKMHNAKIIREITMFRSSIMKLNAMFLDWLVSNIDPVQLQMIHKKPSQSTCCNNSDIRNCSSLRLQTAAGAARCQGRQVGTSAALKRAAAQERGKVVKKQRFDIDPPSFDLGIDNSPVGASFITPKAQVFRTQAAVSPIPLPTVLQLLIKALLQLSHCHQFLPQKKYATELVQDMIDTIEDGSSQKDYVIYAQQISENFSPQPYTSPVRPPSWPTASQQHSLDPEILEMLHIYVRDSKHIDESSLWIVHPLPRHLIVSAKDFKDNFLSPMLTEFHVLDAMIRRLNQLDVTVIQGEMNFRWRHFLESDFASIAGFLPDQTQSVLNKFIHMEYSLCTCQMIIIPVLVQDIWSAYMLDMDASVAHIIDPGHSAKRYAAHVHFHQMINASMARCLNAFFIGGTFSPAEQWGIQYPKLCESFPRHYNGHELESPINKEDMHHLRLKFLFEALSLDFNEAVLPSMIARLIRPE